MWHLGSTQFVTFLKMSNCFSMGKEKLPKNQTFIVIYFVDLRAKNTSSIIINRSNWAFKNNRYLKT